MAWLVILLCASACLAADISLVSSGRRVEASNGIVGVAVDLQTGQCEYSAVHGTTELSGEAAFEMGVGGKKITSSDYSAHEVATPTLMDVSGPLGRGKQLIIQHTKSGSPDLEQIFTLYPNKPWMTLEVRVTSDHEMACNWIAPLVAERQKLASSARILQAPFDNDNWHWFHTQRLDGSGVAGQSHEFTAIFDEHGAGLVIGSITHDFWKTGIDFRLGKAPGELQGLQVYGGASTDDVYPHGAMVGKRIESPLIFLGFYNDYRKGLEDFGTVNAALAPPLRWDGGVPVGWMTFGAFGVHYTVQDLITASNFLHEHLQPRGFCDANGADTIVMDGNGVHFSDSDFHEAIARIHQNKQRAGYYMSPFVYWRNSTGDKLDKHLYGSQTIYADVLLRDQSGKPIEHKQGSYALDASNPALLDSIGKQIDHAKSLGFDYFKLDFLSDGMLEGQHADPNIHTGVQAYHKAMAFIARRIGPGKFISLSIAPAFPSWFAHSRRISCDTYSQLTDHEQGFRPFGSTEYILNCATYSWWMAGRLFAFNDPDEMAPWRFGDAPVIPESWARARMAASIVCGGNLLDTSNYGDPKAAKRVEQILAKPAVNALSRQGIAFEPVHTAGDVANFFYHADDQGMIVVVFNLDSKNSKNIVIRFDQLGLPAERSFTLTDLWGGEKIGEAKKQFTLPVSAGDAAILRLK